MNNETIEHEYHKPIFWQYQGKYLVVEFGKKKYKYDKMLVTAIVEG